jgi:serine/threonine protein kinase
VSKRLETGETFAERYVVERAIGRGGMGAVYLARQEPLGREVAIKVLRPDRAHDDVIVERFRNEAKLIAQLGHPHIVGIHDFGEAEDGTLYLVMERLRGRTLGDALADGALDVPRALHIARDVARALSAAHGRGVVHRDLKPDNIFLVEAESVHDFVKVLDFGIAKLIREDAPEQNLTGTGLVAGTPGYIPPEHVLGNAPDDSRGDLYALGVVLHEMLSGQRPFEGDSAMKLFLKQLEEDAPALEVDVDDDLKALVADLLAREVDDRPASAEEVIRRLDALGVPAPIHPTPDKIGQLDAGLSDLPPDAPTVSDTPVVERPTTTAVPDGATTTSTPRPLATVTPSRTSRARRAALLALALALAGGAAILTLRDDGKTTHEGTFPIQNEALGDELRDTFYRAEDAFLRGEFGRAQALVDAGLQRSPDEPAFDFLRGVLLGQMGDTLAGTPMQIEAAARIEALKSPWCQNAGAVAVAARDTRLEPKRFREHFAACGPCQTSAGAHVLLSRAIESAKLGMRDEALSVLDEGIRKFPATPLLHHDKALLLLDDLLVDEAEAAVRAGEAAAPGAPAVRRARAAVRRAQGKLDEAEQIYKALIAGGESDVALDLAHVYLLRDDEAQRQQLIEGQLAVASPKLRMMLRLRHAQALVGAGRAQEATDLLIETTRMALDNDEPHAATYLVLSGLEAADAAEVARPAMVLLELGTEALARPGIQPNDHAYLASVRQVAVGVDAADRGDLKTARDNLKSLEKSVVHLRPSWRRGIPSYLRYRIALAEKQPDIARENAPFLHHRCHTRLGLARAAELDGADERAAWRALTEPPLAGACAAASYGGAFILRAHAHLAEHLLAAGDAAGAREVVDAARRRFPRADATLPAVTRLAGVQKKLSR